jgi:Zn-dependent protease
MKSSLRIARLFGIDVYVHVSWFVILLVVSVSLAVNVFPALYPAWSTGVTYAVGVAAALLLSPRWWCTMAHSVVAQSQGIRVKHITLFLLGGVSALEEEPRSPGGEALMAAIGPLEPRSPAVLAAALTTPLKPSPRRRLPGVDEPPPGPVQSAPRIPARRRRVLRALPWARTHDFITATRWAARTGQVCRLRPRRRIAMFLYSPVAGLWTGFIGWVLDTSLAGELRSSGARARWKG